MAIDRGAAVGQISGPISGSINGRTNARGAPPARPATSSRIGRRVPTEDRAPAKAARPAMSARRCARPSARAWRALNSHSSRRVPGLRPPRARPVAPPRASDCPSG